MRGAILWIKYFVAFFSINLICLILLKNHLYKSNALASLKKADQSLPANHFRSRGSQSAFRTEC